MDELLQRKPVVKLRTIGYKIVNPRRWRETVISCRDETKLNRLPKLLDVNEQYRKHRWNKVYDAEYPLILTIKSGWQFGLDRLLEIGVDTKQLTSKGEREFEYYDLHELCASHGIDSSLIDE